MHSTALVMSATGSVEMTASQFLCKGRPLESNNDEIIWFFNLLSLCL